MTAQPQVPPAGTTPTTSAAAHRPPDPKPAAKPDPKPDPKPAAKPETRTDDGARALALLEGRSAAATPPAAKPAATKGNFVLRSPRTPRPMTRSRGAASCIRPA